MNKRQRKLYIDQYGNHFFASTIKELKELVGGTKASPMYIDKKDGSTVKVGVIIRNHWLTAYVPYEKAINL